MESLPIKDNKYVGNEGPNLDFKSALKGIPDSVWDTYSAFANTHGGRIILGINDQTKELEGVTKPDIRIQDLWNCLNNQEIVNHNILVNEDIWRCDVGDKTLIVIDIPPADRYLRPIYHRRVETGTFKRNGEGDFRCRMPEIALMFRDQSEVSYDTTILEDTTFEDIDIDTLREFRNSMVSVSPDHPWKKTTDEDLLFKIGGMAKKGNQMRLTLAGLLMFGKEYRIYSAVPNYKLDYQEYRNGGKIWTYRLVTGDGTWNGNIFNFYNNVIGRLTIDYDKPLIIGSDMVRVEDTDDRKAVRECLLNALIHADYLGNLTVKVVKTKDAITISNSGSFRIPLQIAKEGGVSDPRNRTIAKMFSMVGLVERAGAGINLICGVWEDRYGRDPMITEDVEYDIVSFTLPNRYPRRGEDLDEGIIGMIKRNPKMTIPEMARKLEVSVPTITNHLKVLKEDGKVVRIGGTRGYWEVCRPPSRQ